MTTITTTNNKEFLLGSMPMEFITKAIRRRVAQMINDLSSEDLAKLINEGMDPNVEDHATIIPIFTPDELDIILHALWVALDDAKVERLDGDTPAIRANASRMADAIQGVIGKINFTNTKTPVR